MEERTQDALELEISEEKKEEIMSAYFVNVEASYPVHKPPISSSVGPKIAWILLFPRFRASLTLDLMKYATITTTLTNGGSDHVGPNFLVTYCLVMSKVYKFV